MVRLAAGALFGAAVVDLAVGGPAQAGVAVAFTVLVAVGERVPLPLPGDREQTPLATAAALGYALLGPLRGLPTTHGVFQVIAVAGLGTLLGLAPARLGARRPADASAAALGPPRPRDAEYVASPAAQPDPSGTARGEASPCREPASRPSDSPAAGRAGVGWRARLSPPWWSPCEGGPVSRRPARHAARPGPSPQRLDAAARRLLTVAFAATLFQPLYNGGVLDRLGLSGPAYGAFLSVLAAMAALCDTVLAAVQHRGRSGLRFAAALEDELHSLLGIGTAVVATGLLLSLLAGEVGLWALPLCSLPLLLAQASFRRAAAAQATTGQTIETLARATEVAGYTPPGHARRVADTARALGRELGLGTRDLTLLEYAALMHDIGQLSLVEPLPGGATALLPPEQQQRIARLGSEVIRRTGVPRKVCDQVARLADPCRRPDGSCDSSLPLAARIIRVANAHDDLLTAAGSRGLTGVAGRLAALELLRLERGRTYDPAVVDALGRVGTGERP